MRALPLAALLVLLIGGFGGCIGDVPGDLLCAVPAASSCEGGRDLGAVVVRWRISDAQVGQILPRGICCCIPDSSQVTPTGLNQCPNTGSACPATPAWLIRKIQLLVTKVGGGQTLIFPVACTDGELTTEYCLDPGLYDLQLIADLDIYDAQAGQFRCANRQATTPPSVRRQITAGQATNLDGVVIGVNAPPLLGPTDGGAD